MDIKPIPVKKIVMYPRPHPDPIGAIFLLKQFGEEQFPGVKEAEIAFWNRVPEGESTEKLEQQGTILIDLGGGRFDHHDDDKGKKETASTLVAKYLEVDRDPALRKLMQYLVRDDLYGKGIVSKDVIDKAFGLSAIIMNLNKDYPDHPEFVVDMVQRIFLAHYREQYHRMVELPEEWKLLQKKGKAVQINIPAGKDALKVVIVESDLRSLPGFLRAVKDIQADVVVQRQSAGHTNVITRQLNPRIDLKLTVAGIRLMEARKRGEEIDKKNPDLVIAGRMEQVDNWYYDTAANTIQNGGAASEGVTPTILSLDELRAIAEKTLPKSMPEWWTKEDKKGRH